MERITRKNSIGSLLDRAYDHIKQLIITRQLAPGEVVSDFKIAKELRISRTPVRNAIRQLEKEGFLHCTPGKGCRVYTLNLQDLQEIFEVKVELEGMLARKAAQSTDTKLKDKLRDTFERLNKATREGNIELWHEVDLDLHQTIFDMAVNKRATRFVRELNDQWYRLRVGMVAMDGRVNESLIEHKTIVDSILAGEADQAEAATRKHLTDLRQKLEDVLVNMVLPFTKGGF